MINIIKKHQRLNNFIEKFIKFFVKYFIKYLVIAVLAVGITGVIINIYLTKSVDQYIYDENEISKIDVDCILILGASVHTDGSLSDMLQDRVLQGVNAYNIGASDIIIMSGDAAHEGYDEVHPMEQYAIEKSVPAENILTDSAGVSTYDSIYRACKIYGAKKILIVTQKYHLYRAIYIARSLGMEAYGMSANLQPYQGQFKRDIREYIARCKDYFMVLFKPESEYQDKIPNIM